MSRLIGMIQLNLRSNEPIYLQIARQIEQLINAGEMKVNDQLPTVRELATELRINFNTVGRAYRLLDETHLISTQRGRGTYVWEEPTEDTIRQLRHKSLEELALQTFKEARQLGYSPAETIDILKQISISGDLDQTINNPMEDRINE